MTDPRLEATLATWLDSAGATTAPSDVVAQALDAARQRRQRPAWLVRALALGWAEPSDRAVLRPTALRWALVAAAVLLGLLATLWLAGAGARSPLVPAVLSCPAGSDPNEPGRVDQQRPWPVDGGSETWWHPAAFDRESRRAVVYTQSAAGGAISTFDVCTNTWHSARVSIDADRPPAMVYDPARDLTLLFGSGSRLMTYDVESDALAIRGPAPVVLPRPVLRSATGEVVVFDAERRELWTYDGATDRWRQIHPASDLPSGPADMRTTLVAYDGSVDRLVLYSPTLLRTWEFDLATATWIDDPEIVTPAMQFIWGDLTNGAEVAFDEQAARTVIFSMGTVVTYDAKAHDWAVVFVPQMDADNAVNSAESTQRQGISLTYDSVNGRVVSFGGSRRLADEWFEADDVIAFDLGTARWRELLAQRPR